MQNVPPTINLLHVVGLKFLSLQGYDPVVVLVHVQETCKVVKASKEQESCRFLECMLGVWDLSRRDFFFLFAFLNKLKKEKFPSLPYHVGMQFLLCNINHTAIF